MFGTGLRRNATRKSRLVTHGIDKAVFLADRVAVMQAAPFRIVELVDIPFPRPRTPELFADDAFHHLEDRLATLLHGSTHAT